MINNMICIECPKGCLLSAEVENCKVVKVAGAKCPKGIIYAATEVENPVRTLTATVFTEGLPLKLVPVKTDKPIPKKDILRAAEEVRKIRITKPLKVGATVAKNFLGLGVKLVATRDCL